MKRIHVSIWSMSLAASCVSLPAWGGVNDLSSRTAAAVQQVSQVQPLQCTPDDSGKVDPTCNSCKSAVSNSKNAVLKAAKEAGAADAATSAVGQAGLATNTGNLGSNQTDSVNTQGGNTAGANATMNNRSAIAGGLQQQFAQCAQKVSQACTGQYQQSDTKQAETIRNACQAGQQAAGQYAQEQKSGGADMGDLSKAMQAAAGLMQAMGQKGASSPTPDSSAVTPETSSLGSGTSGSSTVGIDTSSPQAVKTSDSGYTPYSGVTSGSSTAGYGSSPLDANPNSSTASATPTAASGGGSTSSSGASRAPDGNPNQQAAEASKENGGFEANLGGGGGSRGLVGLRPSKNDFDNANGDNAVTTGDAALAKLDDSGANRDPASQDSMNAPDATSQDAESIFSRVRTKYAVLKGAGKI